jgi:DNA-binding MarR family transcriptional regulator
MVDSNRRPDLREAIEQLYFAYRAFTASPDRILARRGLGRVHHRILYFVGGNPEISVKGLLAVLAVSKQAINAPLRQLMEMGLVAASACAADRRVKRLKLTDAGQRLEAELTATQARLLAEAFEGASAKSEAGWREVTRRLARLETDGREPT